MHYICTRCLAMMESDATAPALPDRSDVCIHLWMPQTYMQNPPKGPPSLDSQIDIQAPRGPYELSYSIDGQSFCWRFGQWDEFLAFMKVKTKNDPMWDRIEELVREGRANVTDLERVQRVLVGSLDVQVGDLVIRGQGTGTGIAGHTVKILLDGKDVSGKLKKITLVVDCEDAVKAYLDYYPSGCGVRVGYEVVAPVAITIHPSRYGNDEGRMIIAGHGDTWERSLGKGQTVANMMDQVMGIITNMKRPASTTRVCVRQGGIGPALADALRQRGFIVEEIE